MLEEAELFFGSVNIAGRTISNWKQTLQPNAGNIQHTVINYDVYVYAMLCPVSLKHLIRCIVTNERHTFAARFIRFNKIWRIHVCGELFIISTVIVVDYH